MHAQPEGLVDRVHLMGPVGGEEPREHHVARAALAAEHSVKPEVPLSPCGPAVPVQSLPAPGVGAGAGQQPEGFWVAGPAPIDENSVLVDVGAQIAYDNQRNLVLPRGRPLALSRVARGLPFSGSR